MYKEKQIKAKKGLKTLKFPEEDIDSLFKILNGFLFR